MFKSPMCAPGRRRCAILLSVGVALCSAASARAADGPPRQQPPGVHSIICTSDGGIRDDYLADQIANQINAHGGHVKDVKVLVNTCYGGGLADDFARIFDPNGACPGVPWVFGSAAEWYQQAWAFRAEWCTDPNANLGSKFTSALAGPQSGHSDPTPGAMRDGTTDNVSSDLATARQHDEAGPNHEQWESPVIAFGNGGENVTWNASGTSHEVILFGGLMNQPAYYNDMENMQTALQNLYGGAPHTIQVIPDGTIQDLLDGISAACANLDANTQLLLHFTDHGAYSIDVVEVMQAQGDPPPPYTIPDQREVVILLWPPIWPGWPRPDPNEPNDPNFPYDPNDPYGWGPKLGFYLLSPIESEQWSICLNDLPLPLPPGTLEGPVEAPVAWESIDPTENHLKIQAVGQPSGPFVFDAMELSSGPVAMATDPASTAPVSATLGYLFTAPWFPGSATPFEIPLQVDWPAWEPIGPLTYYYVDPRWGDHQGFWGVSGPQQTAALRVRLFSTDDPGELQHVVISADLMTNDPADNRLNAVVQPPDSGFAPPAAYQPQASHATPNPDGSVRYTWEQDLTPTVQFVDGTITLKTGADPANFIFIDNVTINTEARPKDKPLQRFDVPAEEKDKSQSQYYYFTAPEWPPVPHYAVLPTWYEGTSWEHFGSYPPEWLPEVAGHHGVIGLPEGVSGDGQLLVHFDDQAEPAGREYVACQFDYFSTGGGLVWQPVMPPETAIENLHEEVEELDEGWRRVYLTFEVTPPPAWQDFHWSFFTNKGGDPVAIDNFAMSSSPWWADYWHDAFDFYEVGLGLHGQYGWKGWDNNPLADGWVTDAQAHTAFNTLAVQDATDLVQEFDLPASRYVFTTWQYVPSDFQSGCDPTGQFCGSYFILLNTYQDGGPDNWSVQLHADSLTGSFIRDQPTPVSLPLITDRWVRIDVRVDLIADLYRVYYDGTELGTAASWTAGVYGGGGGVLDIGALDLFANGSTTVYYDDAYLRLWSPGDLNCDGAINFGDINPFVMYLANFPGWQTTYVDCPAENGDINGDGTYPSFGDINPFVALLTGGGGPCP